MWHVGLDALSNFGSETESFRRIRPNVMTTGT
jgi:hypothetical protein